MGAAGVGAALGHELRSPGFGGCAVLATAHHRPVVGAVERWPRMAALCAVRPLAARHSVASVATFPAAFLRVSASHRACSAMMSPVTHRVRSSCVMRSR